MTRIRILDKGTVGKIAAGEVIERPASVVKELVENSLDAGAGDIRIRVMDAGRSLIEVSDDGQGMEADDLELATIQHATSKISSIDDLETVGTMGFRGEALSSIAAVASVEIVTKTPEADRAHALRAEGGRPGRITPAARTTGTTVSVRNLFGGHPARLKYLKSDRVEMMHIIRAVTERALANPGVSFRLHNGGVEILNLPRTGDYLERVADIMGRRVARGMVQFMTQDGAVAVRGFLSGPSVTRSTRSDLHLFVNSRPVSSPKIAGAVERGYEGMLMKHRHPVGMLLLDIDPGIVDVNVHPTKRTVRFQDEGRVLRLVEDAVSGALRAAGAIPEAEPRWSPVAPPGRAVAPTADTPDGAVVRAGRTGTAQTVLPGQVEEATEISDGQMLPRMRIIGQILDTYILAQAGTDLVIIDQHAAHERINLERLKAVRGRKRDVQKLITPMPMKLDKRECQALEHYRGIIEDLGFRIEPFGRDTYLVRSVPAIGGHLESEEGLRDLIDELAELGRARSLEEKVEDIMHLVACHSSIRAGEKLDRRRIARLVEEMHGIDNPYTCAHGRPTIIRITRGELERMFRRRV